jgi:hypothetical protein
MRLFLLFAAALLLLSLRSVSPRCNEDQMEAVAMAYVAGDSGTMNPNTGYSFAGTFLFMDCANGDDVLVDNMTLIVQDLEIVTGCAAIQSYLEEYPPWVTQIYGTYKMLDVEVYVDAEECFALLLFKRQLIEYVYNRTQLEVVDAKMWFRENPDGQGHIGGKHFVPKVKLQMVYESSNDGNLGRYLFDYFFATNEEFCAAYNETCTQYPDGWATYDDCMAYVSEILYSDSQYIGDPTTLWTYYTPNLWIPAGDTLACRTYLLAAARTAPQSQFHNPQGTQQMKCFTAGPADGTTFEWGGQSIARGCEPLF